jgi:hypothetical protein
LKEKRALEESIGKLRAMTHADDETKRQLYVEQIKWWIQQAEDEIAALKGSHVDGRVDLLELVLGR